MPWVHNVLQRLKRIRNTRLYRRLPAEQVEVEITPIGGTEKALHRVANWSPGGLFIRTPDVLPLESQVSLELSIDAPRGPRIRLTGQIVRHQFDPASGRIEGMGIMFTDFTQKGLRVLQELLLSASKQEGTT
jgi:Tfp pilus assembly protein PilZ